MQAIREGGDEGIPVMMGDDIYRNAFENFAALAARSISMVNANFSEEKIAAVVD